MNNIIDRSNLRQMILTLPDQFADGFAMVNTTCIPTDFSRVVVSGLGGSALPVNVLNYYLRDLFTHQKNISQFDVIQNRTYTLPSESYNDALNIMCSYSGNTEEVISSFQEAIDHDLLCIGISAGGKIEEMCKENDIVHIKLPIPHPHFQPRMATGYFFATILAILIVAKKIPDNKNIIIDKTVQSIQKNILEGEKKGEKIAQNIVGKTPVIYASDHMRCAAMIWKIKINENSKTPAFWNYFSELNHNELVGFTNSQASFYILMLRDPKDHPRNRARYDITADILAQKNIESEIIEVIETGDAIEKIFTTISLGDWTSYYLALAYNQDPTPVDMVEDFKKRLATV